MIKKQIFWRLKDFFALSSVMEYGSSQWIFLHDHRYDQVGSGSGQIRSLLAFRIRICSSRLGVRGSGNVRNIYGSTTPALCLSCTCEKLSSSVELCLATSPDTWYVLSAHFLPTVTREFNVLCIYTDMWYVLSAHFLPTVTRGLLYSACTQTRDSTVCLLPANNSKWLNVLCM